jgi:regulator of replication initiation timing
MSLQDDLTTVQRRLDDLNRAVSQLEQHVGGNSVDMQRVRTDTDHLREDLALLRQSTPQTGSAKPRPEMVTIPDTPYDPKLWSGAEDEGLGSPYGHAP